jgi:TonB family protein
MRSRSLAISVGLHGAAAALLALAGGAVHAVSGDGAAPPREIPVEIVPPRPQPPPVPVPVAVAEPAPPGVAPPGPASPSPRVPARPSPAPAAFTPAAPAAPAVPATPAPGDGEDAPRRGEAPAPPSGDTAGGSAAGGSAAAGDGSRGAETGAGGSGTGGAGGAGPAIDLSKRPVPLNAASSRVLPYTADALRRRITGDVRLVLHVDARGAVASTTFRQRLGYGLDEIAAEAARKIRFQPARDPLGRPTAGDVLWRFHFTPP